MALNNVVVSSDVLTVIGGPAAIDVNLNSGAPGIRGSRIFAVSDDPTLPSTPIPPGVLPFDLAIVTNPGDNNAFLIYQKIVGNNNAWIQLPPLALNIFSVKLPLPFVNGSSYYDLQISDYFDIPDESYDTSMFSVQYNVEGEGNAPVASSVALSIVNETDLRAAFSAVEFDPELSEFFPANGYRWVHVILSVVPEASRTVLPSEPDES